MRTVLRLDFLPLTRKVWQLRPEGATLVTFVKATFSCFSSVMLMRIDELMQATVDFAFETTLATKSYVPLVKAAQQVGYKVTLLFICLDSPLAAIQRVADRVAEGGHNIPEDVITRRYHRGIFNFINLYKPICDSWIVVNNKSVVPELIAKGTLSGENIIQNRYIWDTINAQSKEYGEQ
jgi:predicted ABC-type ATPase